ncbi:MAG: rod shape-determining protein RodA, partial [Cyanobacteria bacterium P01_H01_bin.130]
MTAPVLGRFRWRTIIQPWLDMDWILLLAVIAMTCLGGVAIRSVEIKSEGANWIRHLSTAGVGLV